MQKMQLLLQTAPVRTCTRSRREAMRSTTDGPGASCLPASMAAVRAVAAMAAMRAVRAVAAVRAVLGEERLAGRAGGGLGAIVAGLAGALGDAALLLVEEAGGRALEHGQLVVARGDVLPALAIAIAGLRHRRLPPATRVYRGPWSPVTSH